MKRAGNIFDELTSEENLFRAHFIARRGKLHYHEITDFEKNLSGSIHKLQDDLRNGRWHVFGYHQFIANDGQKKRIIDWDPRHEDNVVQHAIEQTAGQILLRAGISDTYSGIRNRGVHKGVQRIRYFLSTYLDLQPIYVLKIDIRKFYQSVNNDILKQKIRRKIKDQRVLKLFDEIINSHPNGLPIGNYLSQMLANFYLSEFDHFIKNSGFKHYARYCDDIVIIHSDKERLRAILPQIREKLAELKLTVKENAQIFPIERYGIDFLGYVFTRHKIRLRKSVERRFRHAAHVFKKTGSRKALHSLSAYYGWIKWLTGGEKLWYSIFDKSLKQLNKEFSA